MRRRLACVLIGTTVLALSGPVPAASAARPAAELPSCSPTGLDVGRSPTEPSWIRDLNDRGELVGTVNRWIPTSHREQPFVWRKGVLTLLDKGGWTYGEAVAINNRGQVLGTGRTEPLRVDNVILWDAQGNPTKLNATEDGDSRAYDLNDRGDALVRLENSLGIWRAGRFTPIPEPEGRRFTEPATLNERGWAVGRSDLDEGHGRIDTWVWDGTRRWDITSPLGGSHDSTVATALNVRGQVVGYSVTVEGNPGVSWLWQRGRLTKLTAPGGDFSPVDLDDHGRILGTVTSGTSRHVVIREPSGRFRNLGTFGANGPDSEVTPIALNNRGQVLVYAGPIGQQKVWLWQAGRAIELPSPSGHQRLSIPPGTSYVLAIPDPLNERGEAYTQGTLTNYQTHGVFWPRCANPR
ncbi:hypothetical protein [Cryptosporangium aurantiacum]|uniref:Extracellular repeat, HAF family n=1 Tax=Cryptosporangium aurantiacum TaxID=134849 RepID=A0A1M7NQN5_9ACTN|nr:hypothetical protein [Cryptosporangium aurantiacum]SHN06265.1 hypothetical protein SAMN05443668_102787 [Cryptosporangium aurantiacum]